MRTYDEYSKSELKNVLQNAIDAIDNGLICHPYQMARIMFVLRRKTLEQEAGLSRVSLDCINQTILYAIQNETLDKLSCQIDHFLEHGEILGDEPANNLKILRMQPQEPKKRGRSRKAVE